MTLIFRRRWSPLTGLSLNFSRHGVGASLGLPGFRAGLSSSGHPYVSAGIPGSGLYVRRYFHNWHYEENPRQPIRIPHHAAFGGRFSIPHPVGHGHEHPTAYARGFIFGTAMRILPYAVVAWFVLRLIHHS